MTMKKIISILTAVFMLLAFSACGDKDSQVSTSPTDVSSSDVEIPETTDDAAPQPVSELSICGIPIVTNGRQTGIGYQGAGYQNGVLTLQDVNILADYGSTGAISFVGDLEIVVQGGNTITGANGAAAIFGGTAEDGTVSTLTISGDGSLTITADGDYGISCSGAITVKSSTLDVTAATAAVEGGTESLTLGDGLAVTGDTGTHLFIGSAE
jgi:predicted small lipoprotein YifL